MPCHDSNPHDDTIKAVQTQKKLNSLTKKLCKVMKENIEIQRSPFFIAWYNLHSTVDFCRDEKNKLIELGEDIPENFNAEGFKQGFRGTARYLEACEKLKKAEAEMHEFLLRGEQ